ncbi:MAG: hypothetical protein E7352_07210 [Clostridiales bacterium]|nr:hypothetical protein [Clostridiales bacterium]
MNTVLTLNKNWTMQYQGKKWAANVPGDVTLDFYNNGLIKDPYYGINHRDLRWIADSDFVYENEFVLPEEILSSEEILLEFDGIDTFAEIYFNDTLLGYCDNMFLQYVYSVKNLAKAGKNILRVKLLSTTKKMDEIDDRGYFGTFNVKRLFIRKAQCHFGWDWAPDMPGYGIWGDVRVKGVKKNRMVDVSYKAYNDGNVSLFAELNYSIRPQVDFNGKTVKEHNKECENDILRYTVAVRPNEELSETNGKVYEYKITGRKNFANIRIDNPQLWWPLGYGEHPLYAYKVELIRGGVAVDERHGNLAFRTVELSQKPVDERTMGYKLVINGKEVFVKGSNWVPAECFTGAITDEKYDRLTDQAVEGNFNMLRVWGGGIYEKDVFYDLCDKKGLMVWQDLMLACADIPEDDPAFVENMKKEINYQIKRLRNHPSIVYWCGGNEKTGTYGLQICHGDYFVDVVLRGLVTNLDDSRPYARQSPCALTDIGNDKTSGESHAGSFEAALEAGIENYRECVSGTDVPFISECAIMGPCSQESLSKIFPEDKLWPMNEYWDDRLMDNPYAAILMTFAKRENYYASTLYGESANVRQFIAKGMTVHAEALRAEIEYARANKVRCGGFMNWMYSEIWPSATWSVIDYYCEPKQAYYQMKNSYASVLLTFVQKKGGVTALTLVNDTYKAIDTCVKYGVKTLQGEVVWSKKVDLSVGENGVAQIEVCGEIAMPNTYLYAECVVNGEKIANVYSYDMWHTCQFASDYTYSVKETSCGLAVTIKANAFVKAVTLRLPDNYKYSYSDNYFDMQAGEEKTVYICGDGAKAESLEVTDFAKEIAHA